jgi:hypothetical protein
MIAEKASDMIKEDWLHSPFHDTWLSYTQCGKLQHGVSTFWDMGSGSLLTGGRPAGLLMTIYWSFKGTYYCKQVHILLNKIPDKISH